MERVAVVGIAQTRFEERKETVNYAELAFEVVQKLLEATGLDHNNIDNMVTSSSDFWDGRTISDMAVQDAVGAFMKSESKVSADGALAVLYGMMRILSGQYRTTLVVAHSKGSEGPPRAIENAAFDPIYQRQLGIDGISASALQARAYLDKYDISEEACAAVTVKNLGNALKNPLAQRAGTFTIDQVMESRLLADPIKELDASPITDGACALLLAEEDLARQITDKPVWLKGVGHATDVYYLGAKDLTDAPALHAAAKRAYAMAGIENPVTELDLAEIYDAFSYQELMWSELLGFCDRGGGPEFLASGQSSLGGELPINPSGGILAAHPVFVGGMVRVAEATLQLRGEAGEHQVEGARLALAHGTTGYCGNQHTVWILEGE